MEFLVTMTTHVPDGTTPEAVDDVRAREAVRAGELARAETLRRLWRPPLRSGEWRTLGLFAADDAEALETALASMPLRIWRSDEVTPLAPHPNDPAITEGPGRSTEFLITMTIAVPSDTPTDEVDDTLAREAQHARELAAQGHLRRLWALGEARGLRRTLGLWRSGGAAEMSTIVSGLPLYQWMDVDMTELSAHPSDPAHHNNL